MAQEYLPYDKSFPMNRSHQRQSLAVQWPQCHQGSPVGAYQSPAWPQNAYAQAGSSMSGFSTPSPRFTPHESDHTRSVSRSPEYLGEQWPNDVIYTGALSSSISTTIAPSSRHSIPSRPASAATGLRTVRGRIPPARLSPERQRPKLEAVEDVHAGCFVMEPMGQADGSSFPVSTPMPMEVPLRATQASGEMRGMMSVFRLNPFALQNGEAKRSGSVCSTDSSSSGHSSEHPHSPPAFEAKALEEEPLIFEFQVRLNDPEVLVPESERIQEVVQGNEGAHEGAIVESPLSSPILPLLDAGNEEALHSFPPDFELHRDSYQYQSQSRTQNSWESSDYSESSATWNSEVAPQREYQSSLARAVPPQSYSRKSARPGYQYTYDPQVNIPNQLTTSHQDDYSTLRYSQNPEPTPPRSRTESPFVDELLYPTRHLTIDNSEIYSQNQSTAFYGNVGGVTEDPSTTSSHRRWSLPSEAPGAMMMTSHGMSHAHSRMAMSSDAFLVSHMR